MSSILRVGSSSIRHVVRARCVFRPVSVSIRGYADKSPEEGDIFSDQSIPERHRDQSPPLPETRASPTTAPTPQLFSLKGRTVAITGGGRGVGITLAAAVLEAGGNAACIDMLSEPSPKEWQILQEKASSNGQSITYHNCDITQEPRLADVVDSIAKEAKSRDAPLRGVVACAGIQQTMDAIDYKVEDFRKILDVNVTGAFLTVKHCARHFREQGEGGSVVLVASMSGQIANRSLHCSAYNTSKAAVQQMGRSLAQEWGQYGIRVNTLSPGYIRTAMTDMLLKEKPEIEKVWMAGAMLGRLGAPEDFKAPVIYLLADGSYFMTGSDLRVDGGHCASA